MVDEELICTKLMMHRVVSIFQLLYLVIDDSEEEELILVNPLAFGFRHSGQMEAFLLASGFWVRLLD